MRTKKKTVEMKFFLIPLKCIIFVAVKLTNELNMASVANLVFSAIKQFLF